jgi:hypothetical protein
LFESPDLAADPIPVQVTTEPDFEPVLSVIHASEDAADEFLEVSPEADHNDTTEQCKPTSDATPASAQVTIDPAPFVRNSIDDAEGDLLDEDPDDITVYSDPDQGFEDGEVCQEPEVHASPPPQVGRIGKRLLCKTSPKFTAYADIIPLGSRLAAQSRKRKVRQANLAFHKADTAARKRASITMSGNTGSITEWIDDNGDPSAVVFDDKFSEAIDSSHNIKAVNPTSDAVFCHKCGAYSDGGPLRLLRSTCTGFVAPCRRYWHTVLLSGTVPGPGVRLPSSSKRTL